MAWIEDCCIEDCRNFGSMIHPGHEMLLRKSRQFFGTKVTGLAAIAVMHAAICCTAARAEDPDIVSRRVSQRTDFTDAEIRDGFFKIAFNAELQLGVPTERVRKFDEPVRIFLDSKGEPDSSNRICQTEPTE